MSDDLFNDWRNFPITRVMGLHNRLVGSLSVDELRNLRSNWMACAKDFFGKLDTDALAHYRAFGRAIVHHGLELSESSSPQAAKREEDEKRSAELPVDTPAPQQQTLPVREAKQRPSSPTWAIRQRMEHDEKEAATTQQGPDNLVHFEPVSPKGRTKSVPSARPQLSQVAQFPSESERPCYRVYFQDQKIGNRACKAGVYFHNVAEQDHHTYPLDQWLCPPLAVLATTVNVEGSNYGRLLEFVTSRGEHKKWSMPMALLAGDGTEILRYLYDEGLEIPYPFRKKIPDYISSAKTEKFLSCATRTGWHSSQTFVLPDSVIGQDGVWFQSDKKIAAYAKAGRMENWQQLVAARACGNPFLMFVLSFAFCGPLLERLGFDGVGVHLYGDTTVGKTTALSVGGSVWGGRSYLRSWRSTANGLEGIGVQHTDTLLVLDEIAEINPRELDEVAYFLINGHGKNRADRHGQAKAAARWRVPVLSSGEPSIMTKLAAGGISTKAGQRLRILDVPVSGKYGLFDELHDFKDGAAFADAVRCAAHEHFGYAGPAFVEAIIGRDISELLESHKRFLRAFGELDRQQQRGARVFALAGQAGELATEARITPWDKTEAFEAAFYVFRRWQEARDASCLGTEHREILRAIKDFIERFGESEFSDLNPISEGPTIRDRAGYWEQGTNSSRIYLFTGGGLRKATKDYDFGRVLRSLDDAGAFTEKGEGGERAKNRRTPDGQTKLYHVNPEKLVL